MTGKYRPESIQPSLDPTYTVPSQAQELIGQEAVREIDAAAHGLDWMATMKAIPDPFSQTAVLDAPEDLSFLKPKDVEFIKEASSPDFIQQPGDKYSVRSKHALFRRIVRVDTVGRSIGRHVDTSTNQTRKGVVELSNGIDEHISHIRQAEDGTFDTAVVVDTIPRLQHLAKALPSLKTLKLAEQLLLTTRTLDTQLSSALVSPFAQDRMANLRPDNNAALQRCAIVRESLKDTASMGSLAFHKLVQYINFGECLAAVRLLALVNDARQRLAGIHDLDENSTVEAVEQYVLAIATKARSVIESADRSILAMPAVKQALRRLEPEPLQPTIQGEERNYTEDQFMLLSHQLTVTRDIALGGQRLKPTKAVPKPGDLVLQLTKLVPNREDAPIRGLIIAVLSGRMPELLQTLTAFHDENQVTLIKTLAQQRTQVLAQVREFGSNLPLYMAYLRELLGSHGGTLRATIGSNNVALLAKTVEAYYRQAVANPQATIGRAGDITSVLPPSELMNQLDWTVLPEGEAELEKAARAIVFLAQDRADRGSKVEIDLSRLTVLQQIRSAWNNQHGATSHHFYARGTLTGRGTVHTNEGERPDEYIILILQKKNEYGEIVLEHAIAESPITRVNALYILRSDASAGTWEEIFSLSKREAREYGARRLLHTESSGRKVVDVLTERVMALLACDPNDFMAIRFDGARSYLSRKMGQSAVNSSDIQLGDIEQQ